MTTTDPAAEAAVQVPSPEPAPGTETPGAVPDAAPGFEQDGTQDAPEPALDGAQPYDFAGHARRVLGEPWPYPEEPVIFTDAARAQIDAFDASVAADVTAAIAAHERIHRSVMAAETRRLQDWLNLRARRFPAHAA